MAFLTALTQRKLPVAVVPLTEIQATDGHAKRVIERMTVPH